MKNEENYDLQLNPTSGEAFFMGVVAVLIAFTGIIYGYIQYDGAPVYACVGVSLFVGYISVLLIKENIKN